STWMSTLCLHDALPILLRYLLEDDGAAVVEVAEPRALGSAPRPAALALLVLVTSAPEQDVSPLLVTLRRTGFHAPTLVLTRGMRSEEHTSELQSQSNLV